MEEKNIESKKGLVGVKDYLCTLKFLIPKYQRGYRWSENEIKRLIDDILEFDKNSEALDKSKGRNATFYLLQNLIVCKSHITINNKNEEVFEVVDGQQRLTTVYLILDAIYKKFPNNNITLYNIYYEKYNNKEIIDIISDINNQKNEGDDGYYNNVDSFYLNKAKKIIEKSVNDDYEIAIKIKKLLEEKINFIFYELKDDEQESFTNVNMRKIPLESGDLIKGSLLKQDDKNDETKKNMIANIANAWNRIEEELHNDELFRFYWDKDKKHCRIETIFDIYASMLVESNSLNNELFTYEEINNKIEDMKKNEDKNLDDIWNEIIKYYSYIKDWFNDRVLYHYIGYLLLISNDAKARIKEIVKLVDNYKNKIEIENAIKNKIKEKINNMKSKEKNSNYNDFVQDLSYEKDRGKIEQILILFNILIVLKDLDNEKFSFNKFEKENYDIEHIHPQTDSIKNKKDRINWIVNFAENINENIENTIKNANQAQNRIYKLAKELKDNKVSNSNVEKEYDKIKKSIDVEFNNLLNVFTTGTFDKHGIGNLVLLNESINRGYHNAIYPEKIKYIQEYDMTTKFIPIATKNAMFKYYSSNLGKSETMKWTIDDFEHYQNKIIEELDSFTK